jgi:hypothetical protein
MAFRLWASLLQFTKKSDSKIKSCNLADIKYIHSSTKKSDSKIKSCNLVDIKCTDSSIFQLPNFNFLSNGF